MRSYGHLLGDDDRVGPGRDQAGIGADEGMLVEDAVKAVIKR